MENNNTESTRYDRSGQGGGDNAGKMVRKPLFRRSRSCPLSHKNAPEIRYNDLKLLQKYISGTGKMTPSRITMVSKKKQRELAKAIKRARVLALLPFKSVS